MLKTLVVVIIFFQLYNDVTLEEISSQLELFNMPSCTLTLYRRSSDRFI